MTETISNPDIILHFNENGDHGMIISFSSEIEYSRILNYNSTSIYLKKEGNKIKCYKIFSKLKYLVGISWDERI
jgi:hypothetical protein